MTRSEFRALLHGVWEKSGSDFSGIGVVVCNNAPDLPIVGLRDDAPTDQGSLVEVLAKISSGASRFHDGFHVVDESGRLTHVSQYFSPPIVKGVEIDKHRLVGGRFFAALFGSAIRGVQMTGIVGAASGLSIFCDGEEILHEELA